MLRERPMQAHQLLHPPRSGGGSADRHAVEVDDHRVRLVGDPRDEQVVQVKVGMGSACVVEGAHAGTRATGSRDSDSWTRGTGGAGKEASTGDAPFDVLIRQRDLPERTAASGMHQDGCRYGYPPGREGRRNLETCDRALQVEEAATGQVP
jgi:hypothetical protein